MKQGLNLCLQPRFLFHLFCFRASLVFGFFKVVASVSFLILELKMVNVCCLFLDIVRFILKKMKALLLTHQMYRHLCPILFIYSFISNTLLRQVLHLSQVLIFILIEDDVIFNYTLKSVSAYVNIKQERYDLYFHVYVRVFFV